MKKNILQLFFVLLTVACTPKKQAVWITGPNGSAVNSWFCFRKTFSITDSTVTAIAEIAVDSKYWLWLNDSLIVFEGQLKRGPTPNDTYCDKINLTGRLRKGKNTLAILVWYFGKHGFSHNSSGLAGLYFNCPALGVVSDKSWKVIRHPSFYHTRGIQPNYRLAESNVGFDARQNIEGWEKKEYNDAGWLQAIEKGCPPVKPWGKLVERPVPLFKNCGLSHYVKTEKEGNRIIGYLPADIHVTPYIKLKARTGLLIDMRTDDYIMDLNTACASVRTEYITREGEQEFETFAWMNGHKVIYTVPEGVEVLDLKYRETGYNTDFTGYFLCEDTFYNTLWEKARRTVYVNMRDNFSDCPERERGQWWGDLTNEIAQIHYGFDTRALMLAEKAIRNLVDWQRSDGTMFAPVPAGNWYDELPQQIMASTGYYGCWDYFMYTGDSSLIRYIYPAIKKYIAVWKLDENNLVMHRKGEWDWADWGDNIDDKLLDNAWYTLLLKGAAGMARICGDEATASAYEQTMEKIRIAVNRHCRTGALYRSPGYKGLTDDRANAMMILSGIADSSCYESIAALLNNEMRASPYMERYVLEALCVMKKYDIAMKRMKTRYAPMVSAPFSTLWELWNYRPETNSNGTYNHGWSGGPMIILSKYIAGIAPETPGYSTYRIWPNECGMKEINCRVSTIKGDILFYMNNSESWKKEYRLSSPPGTTAILRLPGNCARYKIKVNGRTIVAFDETPVRDIEGCRIIRRDKEYLYLAIDPGYWVIEGI